MGSTSPTNTSINSRQGRVSLDEAPQVGAEQRLQLVVQPIVKSTVGQRDALAKRLEDFVANGDTFTAIMKKLWNKFSSHISGVATKTDETRSNGRPTELEWECVMQFKWNRHVVPCTKTEQA
ncbi:hypothetical protein PHMEG_00017244 [Phytophthora megakarya]|uniref:Uncharacterized protein n=1 Tax=Phytophthora megakarya TaxID=4795 RepID=A0A225VXA5_9STRA|nr:hypothetical protein PHMEG_00017244 [Phytophthora megakarya]